MILDMKRSDSWRPESSSPHSSMAGGFVHSRNDQVIGVDQTDLDGSASTAQLGSDGTLCASVRARPTYGESDTEQTCAVLLQMLRRGQAWSIGAGCQEEGEDCVAHDQRGARYAVQVTRAIRDQDAWKALSKRQHWEEVEVSPEQVEQEALGSHRSQGNGDS